jgi:hypothetical protein
VKTSRPGSQSASSTEGSPSVAASAASIESPARGPIREANSSIASVRPTPPPRIVAPKATGTIAIATSCEKRIQTPHSSGAPKPSASRPLIGT